MQALAVGFALLLALAPPATADDSSDANRLAVEAKQLYDRAMEVDDLKEQMDLLRKAIANLERIVREYPGSERAVEIVGGEKAAGLRKEDLEQILSAAEAGLPSVLLDARYAVARRECTKSPTPQCLAILTLEAARKDYDTIFKKYSLVYAALVLSNAGFIDESFRIIPDINDKDLQKMAISGIVCSLAKVHRFTMAFNHLKQIDDVTWRAYSLGCFAAAGVKGSDRAKIVNELAALEEDIDEIANNSSDPDNRAGILRSVALARVQLGDFENALKITRTMDSDSHRDWVLVFAGSVLAERGRWADAEKIVNSILEPELRALRSTLLAFASIRAGDIGRATSLVEAAERATSQIGEVDSDRYENAKLHISIAMLAINDFHNTVDVVREVPTVEKRAMAWRVIAGLSGNPSHFVSAREIAHQIEDDFTRMREFAEISNGFRSLGDVHEADATAALAFRIADREKDVSDRAMSLHFLAFGLSFE